MWTKAKQMLPKDILIHARKLEGEEITQAISDAVKAKRKQPSQDRNPFSPLGLSAEMYTSYYDAAMGAKMGSQAYLGGPGSILR
jgi:hypothetical protein